MLAEYFSDFVAGSEATGSEEGLHRSGFMVAHSRAVSIQGRPERTPRLPSLCRRASRRGVPTSTHARSRCRHAHAYAHRARRRSCIGCSGRCKRCWRRRRGRIRSLFAARSSCRRRTYDAMGRLYIGHIPLDCYAPCLVKALYMPTILCKHVQTYRVRGHVCALVHSLAFVCIYCPHSIRTYYT